MQVEWRPITSVKPYPSNPRRNDRAVHAVAESIRRFGWRQPIVVDIDGVIVVGHTRWKAAAVLGMQTVPVTVCDGLSEAEVRAYRIADNKTAELSGWDDPTLMDEVKRLSSLEVPLLSLGFSQDELNRLLAADPLQGQIEPDQQVEVVPRAKHGQAWNCQGHRLIVGGAGVRADVIRASFGGRPKLAVLAAPSADEVKLAPADVMYAWHDPLELAAAGDGLAKAGLDVRAQLIAIDPYGGYLCGLYAVRRGCKAFWGGDRKQSTIWDVPPAAIPVDLFLRPFRNHGADGDRVYSCGAGLGSAVIAATICHRRLCGVGSPGDVDEALSRWEAFSGKPAALEGGNA